MSLADAVSRAGTPPPGDAPREAKKRYSELLSRYLAEEVAKGLRAHGFAGIKPLPGGPGEREFQGGLGPKKVDVSFADERHGLLLAVSIKSICFAPFGKNLKNRFSDMCTEAITLHMRFPYAVVCALFALPAAADEDVTAARPESTFRRATRLFATISGRREYTDPGEKFENVALLRFRPPGADGSPATVELVDAVSGERLTEEAHYFSMLRQLYNQRNPHALVGEADEE